MLEQCAVQGARDACVRFGIKVALAEVPPGMFNNLLGKAKGFGSGQWGAAKELFHNLRGGLGGASNLGNIGHMPEGASGPILDIGRMHRDRAIGNIKTLAPTLLAGGGLYMLHKHHAQQAAQNAAQSQLQQSPDMLTYGGGYPQM